MLGRTAIRVLVIMIAALIAFVALRSTDHLTDILGAILLVLLVGWLIVDLFRARDRLVR